MNWWFRETVLGDVCYFRCDGDGFTVTGDFNEEDKEWNYSNIGAQPLNLNPQLLGKE